MQALRRLCLLLSCVGSACATPPTAPPDGPEAQAPVAASEASGAQAAPAPSSTPGLRLEVQPAEAQVLVDGRLVGTAGALRERGGLLELPPGIHQLVIQLPGYVTWRAEVAVRDRPEPIQVSLQPRG